MRRIEISHDQLEELYVKKKLSTYKIAKRYNCRDTTIGKKLKKAGIKRRNPKKKKIFSKKLLQEKYWKQGYSVTRLAKELGCGHATVWNRFKELGIPRRKRRRYKICKAELNALYFGKGFSQTKIANRLGCSRWVISERFKKFKMKKRTSSEACQKYERKDFSGDNLEKAYLIGFRLGDLHVRRKSRFSLCVGSSTTKKAQLSLMVSLFEKYAHVQNSCAKGVFYFSCILNNTFSFLEPKEDKIPGWILKKECLLFSFLAGYTDAEGNIGVYNGRARYRLGSYDKIILWQTHKKLNELGIKTRLRLESPKGYGPKNCKNNKDFWRVNINYKTSLLKLFNKLEPYLKHSKRLSDMAKAKKNVLSRLKGRG